MVVPYLTQGLKLSNLQLGRDIIERSMGLHYSGCVADPQIFKEQGGPSIYSQMVKAHPTLVFHKADNERVTGWQTMRSLLAESMKENPETPGPLDK